MSSNLKLSEKYDWKSFQERHDNNESISAIRRSMKMAYSTMINGIKEGLLIRHLVSRPPMSDETKLKMSIKKKEWLTKNPDKHPWRLKNKSESKPCRLVKDFLTSNKVLFIEEFNPMIDGRHFSIDIAFPEKMIALEINGNQHYTREGHLKPYYQTRHDLLKLAGWEVIEIHYSHCFNFEKWKHLYEYIISKDKELDFDYFGYPQKFQDCKIKKCKCGAKMSYGSSNCRDCKNAYNRTFRKNIKCPPKEILENLIWEHTFVELGKMFGVSDNAIRKWCKKEGITEFPSASYRANKFLEKSKIGRSVQT